MPELVQEQKVSNTDTHSPDQEQEDITGKREHAASWQTGFNNLSGSGTGLPADNSLQGTPPELSPAHPFDFTNLSVYPRSHFPIQTKLTVNQPGDAYEQEADAVADKVMRMPDNNAVQATPIPVQVVQRQCETCGQEIEAEKPQEKENKEKEKPVSRKLVQRKCAACEEEEKNNIQRKHNSNSLPVVTGNVHHVLQSPGQSLDKSTRSFMERRFGFDFGNIKIHNDSAAHQSAKDINALAYTHQNNIVFGAGQYQPYTAAGKKLLAHELTHVLQQKSANMIQRAAEINAKADEVMPPEGKADNAGRDMSLEEQDTATAEKAKFIVEDGQEPQKGQMLKTDFLDVLNEAVCKTVDKVLSSTVYSSDNCPYIKAAFAKHKDSSPLFIEQLIERYSGAVSKAKSAIDLIQLMQARVMDAVKAWVKTKDLSTVPDAIRSEIYGSMDESAKAAITEDKQAFTKPQLKSKQGDGYVNTYAGDTIKSLGRGQPLDYSTRSRMETALGTNFSDVEIHTGSKAANVSDSLNAKAFTAGNHVAFNESEYQPNTLAGDALLAHELAHVQQQQDTQIREGLAKEDRSLYNQLEEDADNKAISAVSKLWKNSKKTVDKYSKKLRSNIKGGLQMDSCCGVDENYADQVGDTFITTFTWGGDDFTITIDQQMIQQDPNNQHLKIAIEYSGNDQSDGSGVSFFQDFYTDPGIPHPNVVPTKDGSLKIDVYNDGTYVLVLTDQVTLVNTWSPPLKIHTFTADLNGKKETTANEVKIRPLDSVPTASTTVPDNMVDPSVKTTEIADPIGAIQVAKLRLKELINANVFTERLKLLFPALLKQLDNDIASIKSKGTKISKTEKEAYIGNANNLDDSLRNDGVVLNSLLLISKKEMYLEDIADQAQSYIDEVKTQFEQAIAHAYISDKDTLDYRKKGTDLLFKLPYKIASLYLIRGKALDEISNKINKLRLSIDEYRGMSGKGSRTRDIDNYLEDNINPAKKITDLATSLRQDFFNNAQNVLNKILSLTIDSKRYLAVYSIIALFEQFDFFDKKIPWVTSSKTTRNKVQEIRDKLKKQIDAIEPTLSPKGTQDDFEKAMVTASQEYVNIVNDKDFDELLKTIQEDFKNWEKIKFVGKAIVIVAASAFTAGEAGIAMGAAMETAGITGAAAFGAVTFAEALAFTATSRTVGAALFDIKPTESFGKELITNWLMFGYMKKFEQLYKTIAIAMELRGMSTAANIANKGLVKGAFSLGALQLFSWVHETAKTGKAMSAGEFAQSAVFNSVIMGVMHVGKFMFTPADTRFESDIRDQINKNFSKEFAQLEKDRADIKTLMDEMSKGKITDPAKTVEALEKIKQLSAAEMELQLKAGKAVGRTGDGLKAIVEKYTKVIEEADLMLATKGVMAQKGGQLFVQAKPGTLLFEDSQLATVKDILEAYYKEIGGTVELKDGILYGKAGAETTLFVPESKATEMSLPNLLESRRVAFGLVGDFDTTILPEMGKFKSIEKIKVKVDELKAELDKAKELINAEPTKAVEKLNDIKTKMAAVKTAAEKIDDAKVVAGTQPGKFTYRWGGTGKLEAGLRGLDAMVTKSPDPGTGLRTTTAKFNDGTELTFTEREMPATYGGKEVIIDPSNAEIQKLLSDFSVTDPAAQREVLRRLETSMSGNNENLAKSVIEVKAQLDAMNSNVSSLGAVEKQLIDIAAKGRVATDMTAAKPAIVKTAADLEALGILSSRQWLDARTPQEFEGTVGEYLAQKDISATNTAAGKTVYRSVHIIGDMFSDPAGTVPYKPSSGGGSTNTDVVPEIDAVSGNTTKTGFELTDIYNVKAGKGLKSAQEQNNKAQSALGAFVNGTVEKITTNDNATVYIKVRSVQATDAAGNKVDLTQQLKVPNFTGLNKVTYGTPGRGFDKDISASSAEIRDVAKVLYEKTLKKSSNY